jgi:lipopolysaccharide/colanic/teichoic acid biosynthesis glycosyltransferase
VSATEIHAGDLSSARSAADSAGESIWARAAHRALDIGVSAVLLVALAPVLAVIAIVIRLDSSGGIVYRQRRLGRQRKPFQINKFRSMRNGAGHEQHRAYVLSLIAGDAGKPDSHGADGLFKITADDRVTRVGRFLRRSSLDELPQLWNVLRGEMSLVGPRPSIPYEVENYPKSWLTRFTVRPGITGLWQVSGRSQLTWEQMIALDVEYVRRRSFWFNVWILLKTVPVVVGGRGAA